MKKRKIAKLILVVLLLMMVILSIFTIASNAVEIPGAPVDSARTSKYIVGTIIVISQLILFLVGVILFVVGIGSFLVSYVQLKKMEKNTEKKETEKVEMREKVKKNKSRMISFIVIGIVLLSTCAMLQIVKIPRVMNIKEAGL